MWIYLHSHSIKRIQPPYFLVCQACVSWLLTQGLKGGFPGALKFLLWSLQPYQVTDWNPDSFLAVEPGAQTHFAWNPEPSIFKFDYSSSRLHWFLITAFLCFFVRVNGHKETESEPHVHECCTKWVDEGSITTITSQSWFLKCSAFVTQHLPNF